MLANTDDALRKAIGMVFKNDLISKTIVGNVAYGLQ
jgi:ABC-type phosphate transport system ATPase subunit